MPRAARLCDTCPASVILPPGCLGETLGRTTPLLSGARVRIGEYVFRNITFESDLQLCTMGDCKSLGVSSSTASIKYKGIRLKDIFHNLELDQR